MVYIQNKLRTGSLQSMTSATLTSVGPSWIWISVNHSEAAPLVLLSGDRSKNFNPVKYFKSLLFFIWWNIKIVMGQNREKQPGNILFGQRRMYTESKKMLSYIAIFWEPVSSKNLNTSATGVRHTWVSQENISPALSTTYRYVLERRRKALSGLNKMKVDVDGIFFLKVRSPGEMHLLVLCAASNDTKQIAEIKLLHKWASSMSQGVWEKWVTAGGERSQGCSSERETSKKMLRI